jgi:hypothetical protein
MAQNAFKMMLIILVLGLSTAGFAKEEAAALKGPQASPDISLPQASPAKAEEPKEEIREKNLEGEVAGVSPNFIAIDYGQDEKTSYEMTFNITKDTRLERIKEIKKLKPGDTVWVSYNEKVLRSAGKDVLVKDRILKVLRLLNPAKVAVYDESAAGVLSSAPDNAEEGKQ